MKLLAIDTSSSATVVVAADGDRLAVREHRPSGRERPQHTASSLVLANEALREIALGWDDLVRIGVGIGPGSFTGLRSGIAAAAGLARSLGCGVVAVPTTLQYAHAVRAALPSAGAVLAVVDGRRGELFAERFSNGLAGAGLERIRRDELAMLGDLTGVLACGDGAVLEAAAFSGLGAEMPANPALNMLQASSLAALTADGDPVDPDAVRPVYGRDADAVPTAERV